MSAFRKKLFGRTGRGYPLKSLAALALVCGPMALLFVFMPNAYHVPFSYALGAACALLAVYLVQSRSKLLRAAHGRNGSQDLTAQGLSADGAPEGSILSVLSNELKPGLSPTLLGLIRIGNYDRMAAYDVAVAEQVLSAFHDRLQAALGRTRCLARFERHCFAIWFSGERDVDAARAELQALGYALGQQIRSDAQVIEPELEIGSAVTDAHQETPQELIARALASMARPGAANSLSSARLQNTAPELRRRFSLEQDIRHAIGKGEFQLNYQPFVDTSEIRVVGAEALLRWNHPKWGAISPVEFVPILEESGQMLEVGRWVLNTACRQLREWREIADSDFRMAINLSARQLQEPDLKSIIERTVQNHGLSSANIELELTETAAMEDSALTVRLFRSLREAGYSLSIDDFGSGYSSMSYLKNLPFSKLKIDREFVSHVDESVESRAICRALIELASGLGISALAEGVERREEVDALIDMGCTRFQGFYFARPMPAEAFARKIRETDWLSALCSPAVRLQADLKRHYS